MVRSGVDTRSEEKAGATKGMMMKNGSDDARDPRSFESRA